MRDNDIKNIIRELSRIKRVKKAQRIALIGLAVLVSGVTALLLMEPVRTMTMKAARQDTAISADVVNAEPVTLSDDYKGCSVTATYEREAKLPIETKLLIKEIDPTHESGVYRKYLSRAETHETEKYGQGLEVEGFALYDISLISKNKELEPSASVDVTLEFNSDKFINSESAVVMHFNDDMTVTPLEEQNVECDDKGNVKAVFRTDSFSIFAVVSYGEASENLSYTTTNVYKKVTVTSSNLDSLAGTYAVIFTATTNTGGVALPSMSYTLAGVSVARFGNTNAYMTSASEVTMWTFTRRATNSYYISTVYNNTTYYLRVASGSLTTTTTQASRTAFTASVGSNGDIGLASGTSYLNKSGSGTNFIVYTSGPSSDPNSAHSLYKETSAVVFDGTDGGINYYESNGAVSQIIETTANSVTLPTNAQVTKPNGLYRYELKGWFDVVNNIYYDRSMLGQTVETRSGAIFYAEWEAENYDFGSATSNGKSVVTGQPDTDDFIETHVFDYNDMFNMRSARRNADGSWSIITSGSNTLNFVFKNWAYTVGELGRLSGAEGSLNNDDHTTGTQGSEDHFNGVRTTGLYTDELGECLFGRREDIGKTYLGEAEYLYQFDEETGYYYYHSARNAASYNQTDQRFYVYNETEKVTHGTNVSDFLAFNDGSEEYPEYAGTINYWFGISSEIDFYLPDDTGTGMNVSTKGQDMIFKFSGDDDVWVFVDDRLILDMGGMHDIVYGEINFSTGKFAYGDNGDTNTGGADAMPGVVPRTVYDLPLFRAGDHKLKILYMERGSSLSNCAIYFNISPRYALNIMKQDSDTGSMLDGAQFGVYVNNACSVPAQLYTSLAAKENNEPMINVLTIENGRASAWGLCVGKTYYIKEISPPTNGPYQVGKEVIRLMFTNDGQSSYTILNHSDDGWSYVTNYFQDDGVHEVRFTIRNKLPLDVSVNKTWIDRNGSVYTPGSDEEVSVNLYRTITEGGGGANVGTLAIWFSSHYFADSGQTGTGANTDEGVLMTTGDYLLTSVVASGSSLEFTVDTGISTLGIYSVSVNGVTIAPALISSTSTTPCTICGTHNNYMPKQATYLIENITSVAEISLAFIGYLDESTGSASLASTVSVETNEILGIEPPGNAPSEYVETITLSGENNWEYTWSNLPVTDENSNIYYYFVEEEALPGFDISYEENMGIPAGIISITNIEKDTRRENINVEVRKEWSDDATTDHSQDEITFNLIRTRIDENGDAMIDSQGNAVAQVIYSDVALNEANNWSIEYNELIKAVYDVDDTTVLYRYKYSVEETSGAGMYRATYSETVDADNNPVLTITNMHPDDEKLTVRKSWLTNDGEPFADESLLPDVGIRLTRTYVETEVAAQMITVTIITGTTTLQNVTVQANSTLSFWAMTRYYNTYYNPRSVTLSNGSLAGTTSTTQTVNGTSRSGVNLYTLNLGDSSTTVTVAFSINGTMYNNITSMNTSTTTTVAPFEVEDSGFEKNIILSYANGWTRTFSETELEEDPAKDYHYYASEPIVPNRFSLHGIVNNGVTRNTPDSPIIVQNKRNYYGFTLPITGGTGTRVFRVCGAVITVIGAMGIVIGRTNAITQSLYKKRKL